MTEFTIKEVCATGVDVFRRRPWLPAIWFVVFLADSVIGTANFQLAKSIGKARGLGYAGLIAAEFMVQAVLMLGVTSVIWSSAFRTILRPLDPPFRVGMEDWKVFLARLVTQLIFTVPYAVRRIAYARMPSLRASALAPDGPLLRSIAILGVFWTAVAAMWAFGRLEVAPFRCWGLLRGQFWKVAAAFVAVCILGQAANEAIGQAAVQINHHVGLPRFVTLQMWMSPAILFRTVLNAAWASLEIGLLAAIVALAYREPTTPQPAQTPPALGGH